LCLLADIAFVGGYGYDQKLAAIDGSGKYTCCRRFCHSEPCWNSLWRCIFRVFTVHIHWIRDFKVSIKDYNV